MVIVPPSKDHLSCLDGIRFLSMTWVITGHFYGGFNGGMHTNNLFEVFRSTYQSFLFQTVSNAFVSVDTFFLLSGLLVSYLTLKELDRNKGKINIPLFYIHRYLRYATIFNSQA